MASCDFVVQDLNTAASLFGPYTIVWVYCTLGGDEISGITGEPSGLLGFQPRRVIRAGHFLSVEAERFIGYLEHQNLDGRLDRFEVTIAGPPFSDSGEGPSVTINALVFDGNSQNHSFSLTALICDANTRRLHGNGDSLVAGPLGTYTLTIIGPVQHHLVIPPQFP
jgi:hypothetical protein